MYTALQRKALTQATGFERFKNPVHLLPWGLVASWALLHHPVHLRYWRASLELFVLGSNRHILCALVCGFLPLRFVGCGWDQGIVATGAVDGAFVASVGTYVRCDLFYCSWSRSLPWCCSALFLGWLLPVPTGYHWAWNPLLLLSRHTFVLVTYPLAHISVLWMALFVLVGCCVAFWRLPVASWICLVILLDGWISSVAQWLRLSIAHM